MRILRDSMIAFTIGPEGTSIAKFISIFLVLLFAYIQNKLLKKYCMNQVLKMSCFVFAACLLAIELRVIDNNNFKIPYIPILFNKLINNMPVLSFYIVSELFAVFIVTNFWLLCNAIIKNSEKPKKYIYNELFSISQIGVLLASSICLIFKGIPVFIIIGILLIIPVFVSRLPEFRKKIEKEKNNYNLAINKNVLIIPTITVICGMIAGIIDPYTKFQLKNISLNNTVYTNRLSTILILQAIISMILGELFKRDFPIKKLLTPFFLIINLTLLMIFKNYSCSFPFGIACTLTVIGFKALKYSSHSPFKEQFIRKSEFMESILIFEGISGRIGKNLIAVLLSLLFSFSLDWFYIQTPMLILSLFLSMFWFILVVALK